MVSTLIWSIELVCIIEVLSWSDLALDEKISSLQSGSLAILAVRCLRSLTHSIVSNMVCMLLQTALAQLNLCFQLLVLLHQVLADAEHLFKLCFV